MGDVVARSEASILRQRNNVWADKYFAIAIGAIMVFFIGYHWGSVLCRRCGLTNYCLQRYHRILRRSLSQFVFGNSFGRWLLYLVYWAINLIFILTNVELDELTYVAKRLGWISTTNLVLLVFLALKNTPLAPLSATSYEKLRPLHKVAGYTCITTTWLHGIIYMTGYSQEGKLYNMQKKEQIAGAVAGTAMLVIAVSTIGYFMRRFYEAFYLIHIAMFTLILIMLGLHRPKFSKSSIIIIIFTACLWFSDRLLRLLKLIVNGINTHATITPLNGAIRVKLNRSINSTPGSHAFLWIPSIRLLETHPFTMVSTNPAEFVIRVCDGFTSDLYQSATAHPGKVLRCSIDGDYGQIEDFSKFDRVILVAGGSGASFTFAVARALVGCDIPVDFIWTVRSAETFTWFEEELKELCLSSNVNLSLYVTDTTTADLSSRPEIENKNLVIDLEKEAGSGQTHPDSPIPPPKIHQGRPNIPEILSSSITAAKKEDSIGVGVCGPSGIVDAVRKAVSDVDVDGPSVTLYTEEFEW